MSSLAERRVSSSSVATSPRNVASRLLEMPEVLGLDLGSGADESGTLVVRARNPRKFFQEFGRLVVEESLEVQRLESLDDSAEEILGYLLGGKR